MNAPAQPPGAPTNRPTSASLEAIAKDLGEQAGKGRDTQVKFLIACCEHSYHNAVDLNKTKHGMRNGQPYDDATKMAELYVKAQGDATIFDAKAPNQRKLISCLRTAIGFGQCTAGGSGEPLATINKLMNERLKLKKAGVDGLDDAAYSFLRLARAMKGRDTMIDGKELTEFLYKKQPDEKSAEEYIQSIRDNLNKLIRGEAGRGKLQDGSAEIREAARQLTDRLIEIAKGKTGSTP